jgi:hypothetical protein
MAGPVLGKNVGSGADQLRTRILKIIREEIASANRAGIGIAPDVVYAVAGGWALTTAWTTLRTATITVPLGMRSACVDVSSRVYAINSTGVVDVPPEPVSVPVVDPTTAPA